MKISVVVPAFNEERFLGETLASISAAIQPITARGWATELIVCDNNSTDRTADIARAAGARVVFEPINQIARARNTGATQATGDWLLFIDADSQPSPELLADMAEAIDRGDCLAGGSTVWFDRFHLGAAPANLLWNALSRALKWVAGSFIFCEAATFRTLGGFNQELFASEEIELSKRLKERAKAQGRRIVILHRHPLRTSARKMQLYTVRDHLAFLVRLAWTRGGAVRDPKQCPIWYEGRR
jgi:glycosyltransferase involved in cell wall biosynthesis